MTIVASTSVLVKLNDLKTELGISGSAEDIYLTGLILQMSSTIESYLDRTLGIAEYIQVGNYQRADRLPNKAFLVKYPISAVAEVSYTWQDGSTTVILNAETYFYEPDEGILEFTAYGRGLLVDGLKDAHGASLGSGYITLNIKHTGGYDLPDGADTGARDLPEIITKASIELCKNAYYNKNNNPLVKSETVPDVLQSSYFQSSGGSTGGGEGVVDGILHSLDSYLDLRQAF